jgi:uncharacterized protein YkwD
MDVAARLVDRRLRGLPDLEPDDVSVLQRLAGSPHVWPHTWRLSGRAVDHDAARKAIAGWRSSFGDAGERRCGVAAGYGQGGELTLAAVAVDAAADLDPLPIQAHVGAWLSLSARLLMTATGARVVITGPSGKPQTVPTSFDGEHVRARFALGQPGAFTVQVVADAVSGPRPVLEAEIFADIPPWTALPDLRAPGEDDAAPPGASDDDALFAMVQALRLSERLRPLARDPRLDALADAHSTRMLTARVLAHDVGDGDPLRRFQGAGLVASEVGENVARAATLPLAHRALYDSPSHRANLLSPTFERLGIGVARGPDGSVWVTEEFAR